MDKKQEVCVKHGLTIHYLRRNRKWKCRKCCIEAVSNTRRKNKFKLLEAYGGKCSLCGYDKCFGALEFHHLDPTKKDFGLGSRNVKSLERMKKEAEKCILICSNCHREIHYGNHDEDTMKRAIKLSTFKQRIVKPKASKLPKVIAIKVVVPRKKKFEVSKEELENLVWEQPTMHVAKLFGVSDKAIEKRCIKLGVSKPPRGYWTRKRLGLI